MTLEVVDEGMVGHFHVAVREVTDGGAMMKEVKRFGARNNLLD
jgi:hypothetical protein